MADNLETISIIIPIYKVEAYLDACMTSIVGQTYPNLQIIMVDDGSPDHCPGLCDEWARKDSRIEVIHKKNGGLSDARNAALPYVKGEYILFADSDDWLHPMLCEKVLDQVKTSAADIGIFGFSMINDADGKELSVRHMTPGIISGKEAVNRLLRGEIDNYAWNKLYRKELFTEIRYPKGFLWEDIGTTYKVFLLAEKITIIDESFYYYRQRSNNITSTIGIKGLQDIFVQRLKQYEELKEVDGIREEDAFAQLAENAFLFYNRALSESCDDQAQKQVLSFLQENRNKIEKTPAGRVFAGFYKNRQLYDLQYKMRYMAKKVLKR